MMTIVKRLAFSLTLGALFAWSMSTKFDPEVSWGGGAAASAFAYGGWAYAARLERRDAMRRQEERETED